LRSTGRGRANYRVNAVPLVVVEFSSQGKIHAAANFVKDGVRIALICRGALSAMPDDFYIALATSCWAPPTSTEQTGAASPGMKR